MDKQNIAGFFDLWIIAINLRHEEAARLFQTAGLLFKPCCSFFRMVHMQFALLTVFVFAYPAYQ